MKFLKNLGMWLITIALIAVVAYALFFSDLPQDLRDPFTPPH